MLSLCIGAVEQLREILNLAVEDFEGIGASVEVDTLLFVSAEAGHVDLDELEG
jgi:hypothetical protein